MIMELHDDLRGRIRTRELRQRHFLVLPARQKLHNNRLGHGREQLRNFLSFVARKRDIRHMQRLPGIRHFLLIKAFKRLIPMMLGAGEVLTRALQHGRLDHYIRVLTGRDLDGRALQHTVMQIRFGDLRLLRRLELHQRGVWLAHHDFHFRHIPVNPEQIEDFVR